MAKRPRREVARQVLTIVRGEATCRRLMTMPGVGPIAVARKLGVILHRMWREDADFRFGKVPTAATT